MLEISRDDATKLVQEASSAAAGAAAETVVDKIGAAVADNVPLDAIEAVVRAAVPEPTAPGNEGPASAAALAALYVINQLRKGRLKRKEMADVMAKLDVVEAKAPAKAAPVKKAVRKPRKARA